MKKRKWIKWLLLAALVLLVGGWFVMAGRATQSVAYNEVPVTQGSIETYYNFDGLVHAPGVQTITASAQDTVSAVYVARNQQVKKDDKLFKLESGGVVRAGMDGEVTSLTVAEDALVSTGSVLCEIIDMQRLEVELNVDEYDVGAVTPGTMAQVTVLATGGTYEGEVVALDKNGTASGDLSYYTATVALGQAQGVYPGMQVSAKVLRGRAENAAIVRMDAISFDEYNMPYVLVRAANGEDIVSVPVTVGVSDGVYAEITSGVSAGDTVLKESGMTMAEVMQMMQQYGPMAR